MPARSLIVAPQGGGPKPAALPQFLPAAGTYATAQTVSITCLTPSPTIYYTTDGTTPTYPITGTTTLYTSAVTVAVSETLKAIAIAPGFVTSAVSVAPYTISTRYMGANGQNVSYFGPDMPFLNLFKQAGNNSGTGAYHGWFTATAAGNSNTNEEEYVQLDSDGYPTSLTAVAGHTQTYDQLLTYMNVSTTGLPAGASIFYPNGSYTLQFQGAGTIVLGRDFTTGTLSTSSPNIVANAGTGLTITSTQAAGITATVTVNINSPSASGLQVTLTALTAGNYIKALSLVQTSLMASFNAGTILHPTFKATLTGFSSFRFMKWLFVEISEFHVAFTTALANGATSGTFANNGTWTPATWGFPSGVYTFVFQTGQVIPVTATAGSSALTWSTPLSAAIPQHDYTADPKVVMAACPIIDAWAKRPKYTNAVWSTANGVPYDACLAIANELNIDPWMNIPFLSYVVDSTWATNLAQMAFNGTGSTVPGFTGLKSTLKMYVEYSNEVWNGFYECFYIANTLGKVLFPSQANIPYCGWQYTGVKTAAIANQVATVFGGAYGTRATVSMGSWQSSFDQIMHAMNAPDWVALGHPAPYTQNILAMHDAPYFPTASITTPDAITMLGVATPADDFFACMYGTTGTVANGSHTYASGNFINQITNTINNWKAGIVGQPWANLTHYGYESGSAFEPSHSYSNGGAMTAPQQAAWLALMLACLRDPRMEYAFNDPTHQLSVAGTGYIPAMIAAGFTFIHQFQLCNPPDKDSTWGALENIQQTISPLAAAPSKYRGIRKFIGV